MCQEPALSVLLLVFPYDSIFIDQEQCVTLVQALCISGNRNILEYFPKQCVHECQPFVDAPVLAHLLLEVSSQISKTGQDHRETEINWLLFIV